MKIEIKSIKSKSTITYKGGDVFVNGNSYYMLCHVGRRIYLVNIRDGNWWNEGIENPGSITQSNFNKLIGNGFEFYYVKDAKMVVG